MFFRIKKNLKIFGPALITGVILLLPLAVAGAQNSVVTGTSNSVVTGGSNSVVTGGDGSYTLQNPLGVSSICQLIGLLLKAAIAIGIPIAVLFIVWAGFKFVLARGSPGELSEARSNLIATLIGIAIFLGASLIANVIISTLHQLGVNGVNSC